MLLEHERNYGLGMDAPLNVWNTNVIRVWAWMLRSTHGTRTLLGFGHGCAGGCMLLEHERFPPLGHGCSGQRMPLEHERYYNLRMDALAADALVAP